LVPNAEYARQPQQQQNIYQQQQQQQQMLNNNGQNFNANNNLIQSYSNESVKIMTFKYEKFDRIKKKNNRKLGFVCNKCLGNIFILIEKLKF
jgi:hypothetical protein